MYISSKEQKLAKVDKLEQNIRYYRDLSVTSEDCVCLAKNLWVNRVCFKETDFSVMSLMQFPVRIIDSPSHSHFVHTVRNVWHFLWNAKILDEHMQTHTHSNSFNSYESTHILYKIKILKYDFHPSKNSNFHVSFTWICKFLLASHTNSCTNANTSFIILSSSLLRL